MGSPRPIEHAEKRTPAEQSEGLRGRLVQGRIKDYAVQLDILPSTAIAASCQSLATS